MSIIGMMRQMPLGPHMQLSGRELARTTLFLGQHPASQSIVALARLAPESPAEGEAARYFVGVPSDIRTSITSRVFQEVRATELGLAGSRFAILTFSHDQLSGLLFLQDETGAELRSLDQQTVIGGLVTYDHWVGDLLLGLAEFHALDGDPVLLPAPTGLGPFGPKGPKGSPPGRAAVAMPAPRKEQPRLTPRRPQPQWVSTQLARTPDGRILTVPPRHKG
jgi:hypothetical protein